MAQCEEYMDSQGKTAWLQILLHLLSVWSQKVPYFLHQQKGGIHTYFTGFLRGLNERWYMWYMVDIQLSVVFYYIMNSKQQNRYDQTIQPHEYYSSKSSLEGMILPFLMLVLQYLFMR